MADKWPERQSMTLEGWEESFFKEKGWTRREIDLLKESSTVLYHRAEELMASLEYKALVQQERDRR